MTDETLPPDAAPPETAPETVPEPPARVLASPPHYRAVFDAWVEPARKRPALWRLLLGMVLVIVVAVAWQIALMLAILLPAVLKSRDPGAATSMMENIMTMAEPWHAYVLLALFAGVLGGVALAVLLHRRSFRSLIAAPGRPVLAGFGRGFLVALALGGLGVLISLPFDPLPARTATPLADWAIHAAILLPLLLIQTGAEELVFRGYLMQQLAARFRSPLVWALVPALLFGAMHFWNAELLGDRLLYVLATMFFGFAAAAMVWRSGSLAPAMGFHLANNFFVFGLVGVEGKFGNSSLFAVPEGDLAPSLAASVVLMALVALLALSRWSPFHPAR